METFIEIIIKNAHYAHWYVFGAIVLAGFNIPISVDVLVVLCAFLAAAVVPEYTWHLFFSILFGCYLSAWCSYGVGRFLGAKLSRYAFFSKFFPKERIVKIRGFYEKYGLWTLVFGRFIPFGVRNCIFMTTGMSRVSFPKFMLMDAVACSIWCSTAFYVCYLLGNNYQVLWQYLKTFNLLIFAAFSVTLIAFIWYKKREKARSAKKLRVRPYDVKSIQ